MRIKIMGTSSPREVDGCRVTIMVGDNPIKTTLHLEDEGDDFESYWVCSDAQTGSIISTGYSRTEAIDKSKARILLKGYPVYAEAVSKFREILFDGRTIDEVEIVPDAEKKYQAYNAWAKKRKEELNG